MQNKISSGATFDSLKDLLEQVKQGLKKDLWPHISDINTYLDKLEDMMKQQIREYQNNLVQFKEEIKNKDIQYEQQQLKKTQAQQEYKIEIQQLKRKIEQLEEENTLKNEKIATLNSQLSFAQNSHDQMKGKLSIFEQNKLQEIGKYEEIQDADDYDIKIKFDSLKNLIQGQELELREGLDMEVHKKMMNTHVNVVSTLGKYDSGKTYLIANITNKNLNQGFQVKTHGLNYIYGGEAFENVVFADTQGSGEPLRRYKHLQKYRDLAAKNENCQQKFDSDLKETNKNKNEFYKNYIASQKFLQAYLLETCQVIIMVVNILDDDQESRINFLAQSRQRNQIIYVVHNFHRLSTVKQVEKQIQVDILDCFQIGIEGQKQTPEGCIFFKERSLDNQNFSSIIHLVLGQEGEESGNKYNNNTFNFLKQEISALKQEEHSINYFDSLKDYSDAQSKHYLEIPKGLQDSKFTIKDNKLIVNEKWKKNIDKIKLKDIHYNFWGDPIKTRYYGKYDFRPQYSVFEHQDYYIVLVQFVCSDLIKISKNRLSRDLTSKKYYYIMRGGHEKDKLKDRFQNQFNIVCNKYIPEENEGEQAVQFGKFELRVDLCSLQQPLIEHEEPKYTVESGCIRVKILKINQNDSSDDEDEEDGSIEEEDEEQSEFELTDQQLQEYPSNNN